MSATVRHPEISVQLSGTDGNAFSVLSRMTRALRAAGCDDAEVQEFMEEATTGSYDLLLATCMSWVDVS
jgi:hypothetical protein